MLRHSNEDDDFDYLQIHPDQHKLKHMSHLFGYRAIAVYLEQLPVCLTIVQSQQQLVYPFLQGKQLQCNDNHKLVHYNAVYRCKSFQYQLKLKTHTVIGPITVSQLMVIITLQLLPLKKKIVQLLSILSNGQTYLQLFRIDYVGSILKRA